METSTPDANLSQILNYSLGFYDRIDAEIAKGLSPVWLPLGHYIIMIVDGTHLVKRCFQERSYKNLSGNKEL